MSRRIRAVAYALLIAAVTTAPAPASAQRWTLPAETQQEVDAVFDFIERDAPGCALGVVQDGALAYGRGYGLANLDWGIPLTTSTVFDIGSVSKQFTATALALLELDGVLSLDDEVRTWIPELPDYGPTITIRHLLNHTSGIRDYLTLQSLAGFEFANVMDEHDGVELIVRQKALNFEPGSEYLYSNSGYLLLANIVRRATGQSLREFLEERVFDPLGMAHTSIWDDNTEIVAERATGYSPGDPWEIDHAWNFQMGGDGQVITSIDDLVKWDANFYDPVVGGTGLLDRLHTQAILNDGDTIEYALGIGVSEYRGLRRVAHGGAWAGFRAHLTRFPDQRTSIIVECNRGDANTSVYVNAVADAVLEDDFTEEATTGGGAASEEETAETVDLSREQLETWSGLYRDPDQPDYVRFEISDGGLSARAGGDSYPLEPRSESSFFLAVAGLLVTFEIEDGVRHARIGGDRYRGVEGAVGDNDALRRYVGRYWSDELDVAFEVRPGEEGLELLRPNRDPTPLLAGIEDEFEAGGYGLTFEREGDRITGLRVFAGRVTGIVFQRESM